MFAATIVSWLDNNFSASAWEIFRSYLIYGVFDPMDLIATGVGGFSAIFISNFISAKI